MTVLDSHPRLDAALVDRVRALSVSVIGDVLDRMSGSFGLRPFHAPGTAPMVGTAYTVRTRAGDNLAIYQALQRCAPGDVLVVDGAGAPDQALVGEIMTTYAESIGLAGVVLDGAVRDVAELRARSFPVFARSATHRGPFKDGPGELAGPVTVGGMVVRPGDVVLGDDDGLVAVAPERLSAVLGDAEAKARDESEKLAAIAAGTYDLSWVPAPPD